MLADLAHVNALPALPWTVLALNATRYLDVYLAPASYHAAVTSAIEAILRDRFTQFPLPSGDPAGFAQLQALADAPRAVLYRHVFEQAVQTGRLDQLILAQHVCEIAEVVAPAHTIAALRVGVLPLLTDAPRIVPSAATPSADALLLRLCHALVSAVITPARFGGLLMALHAARRAYDLIDPLYDAPLALVAAPIFALPNTTRPPKRLAIVQPRDLAQRAVALPQPQARLVIEAGLVEAQLVAGASRLLLLAALDRVLAALESRTSSVPLSV